MSRPGRPGQSCACGALIKATNEIKSEGLTCNSKVPGGASPPITCSSARAMGQDPAPCNPFDWLLAWIPALPFHMFSPHYPPAVHDFADPEMSVLKQRIARRLFHEGATDESVQGLTLGGWPLASLLLTACCCLPWSLAIVPDAKELEQHGKQCRGVTACLPTCLLYCPTAVDVTKVAERTISDDLEHLISQTVDTSKADYAGRRSAVFETGVSGVAWVAAGILQGRLA